MILCAYECGEEWGGGGKRGGEMREEGKEEKGDRIEKVKDRKSKKVKGRKICIYKTFRVR